MKVVVLVSLCLKDLHAYLVLTLWRLQQLIHGIIVL
jgi:hypothetical protein